MRISTLTLAATLATLSACSCDSIPAGAVQDCTAAQVLPDQVATDILFVVDDSLSMAEEQANLAANLGAFVDALVASPVQNDFQIGVTSTSVDDFGPADAPGRTYTSGPSDGRPFPRGAIVAVRQDARGNGVAGDLIYDPVAYPTSGGWGGHRLLGRGGGTPAELAQLAQDFKANVRLGTAGTGKEQPFRAARLALTDRLLDANAGFLRPGARLAVIFLTDEDDCSESGLPHRATSNDQCHDRAGVKDASPPILDTVDDFAAFLLGPLDGERRDLAVGAIAGLDPVSLAPSCGDAGLCSDTACSTAFDESDRFAALVSAVGGARMRLGSICDASFHDSLTRFAEILMPTSLPLAGTPADWRMLLVTVTRAGGATVGCTVAAEGSSGQAAADAVYSPPRFGRPAQLSFQNACQLGLGDRIDLKLVCAG